MNLIAGYKQLTATTSDTAELFFVEDKENGIELSVDKVIELYTNIVKRGVSIDFDSLLELDGKMVYGENCIEDMVDAVDTMVFGRSIPYRSLAELRESSKSDVVEALIAFAKRKAMGEDVGFYDLPSLENIEKELKKSNRYTRAGTLDSSIINGVIRVYTKEEVEQKLFDVVYQTLMKNVALSDVQVEAFEHIINSDFFNMHYLVRKKFKNRDTLAALLHTLLKNEKYGTFFSVVKSTEDIARSVTLYIGQDDVNKVKFVPSLSRKMRRAILNSLDRVVNEYAIAMHKRFWKAFFTSVHVFEYDDRIATVKYLASKVFDGTIKSFESDVEEQFEKKDMEGIVKVLSTRPTLFMRSASRIATVAKETNEAKLFFNALSDNMSKVSLKSLIEFYNKISNRSSVGIVIDDDGVARTFDSNPYPLSLYIDTKALIEDEIKRREVAKDFPKFRFTESAKRIAVSTSNRGASETNVSVPRFSAIPLDDMDQIVPFIFWKAPIDIDLSVGFFDSSFNNNGFVSYTNLSNGYAHHSGDITNGSNGAAEYVIINKETALKNNTKYAVVNVYSFSNVPFNEMDNCYSGLLDAKISENHNVKFPQIGSKAKFYAKSSSKMTGLISMIIDIDDNMLYWVDASIGNVRRVEEMGKRNEEIVESIISRSKGSMKMENLFKMFGILADDSDTGENVVVVSTDNEESIVTATKVMEELVSL